MMHGSKLRNFIIHFKHFIIHFESFVSNVGKFPLCVWRTESLTIIKSQQETKYTLTKTDSH